MPANLKIHNILDNLPFSTARPPNCSAGNQLPIRDANLEATIFD